MQTKPLLYGLIGFFIGGFIVAVAATTFDKSENNESTSNNSTSMYSMSMDDMATQLQGKTGDDYDKVFLSSMIAHHEGAVAMAKLSAQNAKHDEIKTLSTGILAAQEKEINQMKQWQMDWDYSTTMEGMDHSAAH